MSSDTDDLVILGAGAEVPQYLEALELRAERGGRGFAVAAVLDDNPATFGRSHHGHEVRGPLARVTDWPEARVLWGLGSARAHLARLEISRRLELPLDRYFSLIHPDAVVSRRANLAPGVTVLGGTRLTAGVRVGAHASFGFGCLIEHDTTIGPGTLFSGACLVAGHVRIGAACFFGQGCNIRDGIRIGDCAVIGIGAVVLRDVADGEVIVGNPGRVLRTGNGLPELLRKWRDDLGGPAC